MSLGEELFAGHRPRRQPDDESSGDQRDPDGPADADEADADSSWSSQPDAPTPATTDSASAVDAAPDDSVPAADAAAPVELPPPVAVPTDGDGTDHQVADDTQVPPAPVVAESSDVAGMTDSPASDPSTPPPPRPERDDVPRWVGDAGPDATMPLTVGSRPAGPPAPGATDGPAPFASSPPVTAGELRDATATTSPRPTDPDATTVIALDGRAATGAGRSGARAEGGEVWDTGTIRRWDPSMTDERPGPATSAMHRPYPLDDRQDVDLDEQQPASRWYEVPLMILIALTLAFLLRTFVVQVFYIPSESMIPTLEVNDRIAVEKLSYIGREPARGEVIVFAGGDPFDNGQQVGTVDRVLTGVGQFVGVVPVDAKDFVKRVIGLPGDTVVLEDGVVSVNGTELDETYACLDQDSGQWEVPAGQLFVMGDNRANSGDSRTSLGYISVGDVVGRAFGTIWPFDRAGSITGPGDQRAGACP